MPCAFCLRTGLESGRDWEKGGGRLSSTHGPYCREFPRGACAFRFRFCFKHWGRGQKTDPERGSPEDFWDKFLPGEALNTIPSLKLFDFPLAFQGPEALVPPLRALTRPRKSQSIHGTPTISSGSISCRMMGADDGTPPLLANHGATRLPAGPGMGAWRGKSKPRLARHLHDFSREDSGGAGTRGA